MNRVLIVDDMEIIRRTIKRLKIWGEASGFVIVGEAEDGQEALKILEAEPVDLIITDIRMPVIDGIELLKKVTENRLATCVVLLSDYTEFNYARQGFVHGAFDYLGKPVDEKELLGLLERVGQHLAQIRQEEEKLKQLQGIAAERLQPFYPASAIQRIIECLQRGDSEAMEIAGAMVDQTSAALQHDLSRTSVVVNHAMQEVWNAILSKNQWIGSFVDASTFLNNDTTPCPSLEALRATVVAQMEQHHCRLKAFSHCGESHNAIRDICRYALEHIDGDISVKTLAEKLFISRTYISDLFRQKTGVALTEYLMMLKMERAKKLIQDGVLKNYEIAERLCYQDVEYFSRLFKKYSGVSPIEYRKHKVVSK